MTTSDQLAPSALSELCAGTRVDHFVILRPLGRGGAGEVYLARDTELGRRVALKLIRSDSWDGPEVAERFRREARITARFNHPHIVTIHAVGEYAGRPYVALEYLEGQTLRERLVQERPAVGEVMRYGLAIAEALTEAHAHEVLHRDLKPENVILPRDGRLRVLDFGLAKAVGSALGKPGASVPSGGLETAGLMGTPAYMAPEQWRSGPVTAAVDVWALGVILHELLEGQRPFDDQGVDALHAAICSKRPVPSPSVRPDVPDELIELVQSCLSKAFEQRPAADQVARRLRGLIGSGQGAAAEAIQPFRGLQPFTERDQSMFFGREREVASLLERLRGGPVVPVIGPSGVGKSSLVWAGLIPRLREQGRWTVLRMRPGRDPFGALSARLTRGETGEGIGSPPMSPVADPEPDPLVHRQSLESEPGRLVLLLQGIAERERSRVLLFVDQFEELFSQVPDEITREAFVRAICQAVDDPAGSVRVVFTLREDFLGHLARVPGSQAALQRLIVLHSPAEQTLLQILRSSVERAGLGFEDDLLAKEMVAAVREEASSLALIQFTGQRLFEQRDREHQLLTRAAYEHMGGVEGALTHHADQVLEGLSADQVLAARQLLLRLITPDGTRRSLARVALLDGLGPSAGRVLDRLVEARMLTGRRRAAAGQREAEPELELVHEALASGWQQLVRWREQNREGLRFLEEIEQAAQLWHSRGRSDSEVWTGVALGDAERRLNSLPGIPGLVEEFIGRGRQQTDRRRRRRRILLAVIILGLILLSAVATGVALVFDEQASEAENLRLRAEQGQAEALRAAAKAAFDRGEYLQARARVRMSLEAADSAQARALWADLERQPHLWEESMFQVVDLAWSPKGAFIAVAPGGPLTLLNAETGGVERSIQGSGAYFSLAFSPDGKLLAGGGTALGVWSADGTEAKVDIQGAGRVRGLCFLGSDRLVSAGSTGATIWRVADGSLHKKLTPTGALVACAPSADLVLGSKGQAQVTLWNGHTGEVVEQVGASMPGLSAMAITPDGTRIALADDKGRIYLRTRGGTDPDRVIAAHQGPIHRLVFTPDGKRLASSGEDGVAAVWELNSGELQRRFAGPPAGVRGLGFDPAGQRLAVAERSGRIRVWDLRPNGPPREPVGHEGIWVTAEIDSRLGLIASGELMGGPDIWLWDVETGQARGVLRGHEAGITDLSFQPGRARLASSSADGTVRIWDLESKTIDRVLHVCKGKARAVAFDERGELLAAGGVGGEIRIWNPRTGQLVRRFAGQGTALRDLAFRPGGSALAASYDDGSLRLWSPDGSQRVPGKPEGGYAAWGVAFSPNGQILAAAGKGGPLLLVDLADDSVRSLVQLESSFGLPHRSIAFHPTRPWIGAAPGDAIPRRIWDTDSGNEVSKFANSIGPGVSFSFGADGRFALSEDASAVSLWDPETGAPLWRSSLLMGPPLKVLTHRGWLEPGSGEKVKSPLGTRLQQALQRTGTRGAVGADGDTICLLMLDGALEAWSLSRDERLLRNHEQIYVKVVPLTQACVAGHKTGVQSGVASFISADSKPHKLADGMIGDAPDGDGVLVVTEKHLYSFDGRGRERKSWPLANVVHSAIRLPEGLALGHFNGFVEIIDDQGARVRRLRDTPSVPISMLRPGPADTLIVAAANGRVGVWHIPSGERLSTIKLNGVPTSMAADGSRWAVATSVGDHAVLDLSIYESERCELMRRVWQKAPVVWEAGRPQVRAAPTDHLCSVPATSPLAKSATP